MQPPIQYLSEDDPRYKCCCGCMHVRTAAIVIGILKIVGSLYMVGRSFYESHQGLELIPGAIYINIVSMVITIVVEVIMFVGISKQKAELIIPHLVFAIVSIIWLIVAVIIIIVVISGAGVLPTRRGDRADKEAVTGGVSTFIIFLIVVSIGVVALEVWFFVVILQLYRFYRDMASGAIAYPNVQYVQPVVYAPPPGYPNVQYAQPMGYAPPQPAYEAQNGPYPKAV